MRRQLDMFKHPRIGSQPADEIDFHGVKVGEEWRSQKSVNSSQKSVGEEVYFFTFEFFDF